MSDAEASAGGPLSGLCVVELGVVIAGPSAASLLGEWGAEVIKVEPFEGDPQRGNTNRAYFELDNRAKRSLCLDLKTAEGNDLLTRLLDTADVFVTNIRPGALARLGLDHETLAGRNPRLVYGLIGGYSATGPAADKAGYDVGAFWSRAGVAAAIVGPDTEPPVPRPGLGDHTTALALVAGINAALVERARTGRGRLVTTSLLRTGAFVISSDLASQLAGSPPETGLRRAMYNPLLACYRAGDGRWFWLLGLQADRHWPNVLRAVGRDDLLTDERFTSFGRIMRNGREVIAVLDVEFAKRTLDEWSAIFTREDVWWDPVQTLEEVVADPVVHASGAIVATTSGGQTVASPVSFDGYDPGPIARAPEAGEHTEQILLELGLDWTDIAALHDAGVIP
jgi:crotonobetainyl-CoA:carnitine CoA-transferase CaiB-like acyl-CoA transferase